MIGFSAVLLLLCGCLPLVRCDIDFMDCGSERVYIDKMDIPGCEQAPCSIERGFNYLVYVVPSFLEGPVDSIEVTAYVRMWGALFAVPISSVNPCGFICPLQQYIEKPTLIFNVLFPETLQRRRADLVIRAIHRHRGSEQSVICVSTDIQLL
ncbi:uncharacterized protein LOC109542702 [Dendroctonus ponderosae]